MEIKKCKFCGAPIVWLKTQNGRPMPCNADAVKYQENYKGKDVIVLSDGKVIKATVVNPNGGGLTPIVDGEGYISHFATCTHANEARQPRRKYSKTCNGGVTIGTYTALATLWTMCRAKKTDAPYANCTLRGGGNK